MSIVFILFAFFGFAPSAATAAQTPQPSSTNTQVRQGLTQAQKAAISAARSTFAAAKADAVNGRDRALADAKAIRDQAVVAAGSNQGAIQAANMNFKQSYKTILSAYKADLLNAKAALLNSIAAVKANK